MNGHDTYLALAAAGIDFPLTPEERRRLEAHLAGCTACRRAAAAMRTQADVLGAIPVAPLSDRRADEMLATILAQPAVRHPLRLVLVAALLALLALGSVVVGASLLHRADDLAIVPPAPSPSLAPAPTASAEAPVVLGTTWLAGAVPTSADRPGGHIEAVTAGGPGFVAVGRGCRTSPGVGLVSCQAVAWTSPDGRTWAQAPASEATDIGTYLPTSGPEIGMFDVAAGPPGIVAIGYAGRLGTSTLSEFDSAVWFSADGTSWERLSAPLGDASNAALRPQAVAWTGGRFVIVGEDRTALGSTGADLGTARAAAAVWTSPDGRAWVRVADGPVFDAGGFIDTMEDPSSGGMRDVVAGPSGLVAVGSACEAAAFGQAAGCTPVIWTSPDGATWTRSAVPAGIEAWLGSVATFPTGYVAAGVEICAAAQGTGYGACPSLLLTSPDGRVWVRQAFPQSGQLQGLTLVGDRLFAIAPEGPTSLWTSPDGSVWTPAEDDPDGPSVTRRPPISLSETHLAATRAVAVWVGSTGETDLEPQAWYSETAPAP